MRSYEGLRAYFGDLHSHCAVGYGHGSLEEAFTNARHQLDFAAVTVHGHWPDMPDADERLADLVNYHQKGFRVTRETWPRVREIVEENHHPGHFIPLLAFEWHSSRYGDHNVYFKGGRGEVLPAPDLEALRRKLRSLGEKGVEAMLIPHHIGYKQGYRGINWESFSPEFSPVAEIMSMHGCAESPDAPYPYLHTMGPRDGRSTYQHGLAQGHLVGAVGSTDHHSAHPGSHGHGRMGVWSEELTRDAIWKAIQARRTYALTGDNIAVQFAINGKRMGAVCPPAEERRIAVSVEGGSTLDYVEVLHNNRILKRVSPFDKPADRGEDTFYGPIKIELEMGWSEKGVDVDWEGELEVAGGELLGVEPRFKGRDVVAPRAEEDGDYAFSRWGWERNAIWFQTRTWGNPTTATRGTQALSMTVQGAASTQLQGTLNGTPVRVSLGELLEGPRAGYLGGFLTPAYAFQRAAPRREYALDFDLEHRSEGERRDWYYLRVRQRNGQWAWTSPIWVEGE